MKRLLCIVSSMDRGGAETFLMKIYRNLDKNKFQMDFCVSKKKSGFYDNEIKKMGGRIYVIPPKSKKPLKSFIAIKNIVKKNRYDSVLRTSQQSLATLDLLAAKFGGAKNLIYRSSNAGISGSRIKKIINKIFSFLPKIIPNIKIAPSTEAARFVFGNTAVKKGNIKIIPNGLDYNLFEFDENKRNNKRNELKISDNEIVYGHIGRFDIQKNHAFLIDIFNEIYKKNKNCSLLLIGEGNMKDDIIKKVYNYGLSEKVIFLEPTGNVSDYLMAMDLLIFPSFFEGMPNVVIEAQASGLKCLISDRITKECSITNLVDFCSLDKSALEWANKALENRYYKRKKYLQNFEKNGYCIKQVINDFLKII